jgi:hypothetical protein
MEPAHASRDRQVGPGLVAGPGRLPGTGRQAATGRPACPGPGRRSGRARPVRPSRLACLAATTGAAAAGAAAVVLLITACAGPAGGPQVRAAADARAALARRAALVRATANLRTSCRSVAYLGDATSEGMDSPLYLPDPAQRLVAQYRDVGVQTVTADIADSNSVAGALSGALGASQPADQPTPNLEAAVAHDCWVVALGTNDTADVAAGSGASRLARIRAMMSAARGRPVLWVNLISLLSVGPYSEANMRLWNQSLRQACSGYPNMRIYDWASEVKMRWFLNDGIRYTTAGYAARARRIAKALARAFPASGHSTGCTVS